VWNVRGGVVVPAELPEVDVDGERIGGPEESAEVASSHAPLKVHLQQPLLAADKAQRAVHVDLCGGNDVHETSGFSLHGCSGGVASDVDGAVKGCAC